MRKIIDVVGAAALAACVVGCKSMPTTDTMYSCSFAIGVSAGMVANGCKIDDTARNEVIEIVEVVREVVPETNQTFAAAWTPIAKAHTDALIAEGKIDAAQGQVIMAAFNAVVVGIDYVFYRYPTAKQYQELTSAAIDGFADGFLLVFKPVNEDEAKGEDACANGSCVYDAQALKAIRNRMK